MTRNNISFISSIRSAARHWLWRLVGPSSFAAIKFRSHGLRKTLLEVVWSDKIERPRSRDYHYLRSFFFGKNLAHRIGVKLDDYLAWVSIHRGDRYRVVWTKSGRVWIGGEEVSLPNDTYQPAGGDPATKGNQ